MIRIISLSLVFVLAFQTFAFAGTEKQLRNRKGVQRWVITHEDSKIKSFRASREIELQDPYALLAIFEDYEAAPRWIHMLTDLKEISKVSPTERQLVMMYQIPWPFYDRQAVVQGRMLPQLSDKELTFRMESSNDLLPPPEGRVLRVPYQVSEISLELKKNNKAVITIQAQVDPGGNIPAMVVNMLMRDIPYHTLMRLDRMLKQDKYHGQKSRFPHVNFAQDW